MLLQQCWAAREIEVYNGSTLTFRIIKYVKVRDVKTTVFLQFNCVCVFVCLDVVDLLTV